MSYYTPKENPFAQSMQSNPEKDEAFRLMGLEPRQPMSKMDALKAVMAHKKQQAEAKKAMKPVAPKPLTGEQQITKEHMEDDAKGWKGGYKGDYDPTNPYDVENKLL